MSAVRLSTFGSEVVRQGALPIAVLAWARVRDDAAAVARAISLCTPDDVVRARRQRFLADQRRAILRRATARRLLAWQWRRPARGVRLLRRPTGQPFSPDLPGSVSLSYADDVVLVATSTSPAIGCDIARALQGLGPWPGADATFAAAEVAWMREREARGEGPAALTRAWTLKEACGKATGDGLLLPLDHVDTTIVDDAPRVIWHRGTCWLSRRWEWPGGYHVALVVADAHDVATAKRWEVGRERELYHAG